MDVACVGPADRQKIKICHGCPQWFLNQLKDTMPSIIAISTQYDQYNGQRFTPPYNKVTTSPNYPISIGHYPNNEKKHNSRIDLRPTLDLAFKGD